MALRRFAGLVLVVGCAFTGLACPDTSEPDPGWYVDDVMVLE